MRTKFLLAIVIAVLLTACGSPQPQIFPIEGEHIEGEITIYPDTIETIEFQGRVTGKPNEEFKLYLRIPDTLLPQWANFRCDVNSYDSAGNAYVHCSSLKSSYFEQDAILLTTTEGVYFGDVEVVEFESK